MTDERAEVRQVKREGGWGADWISALAPALGLPNDGVGGQELTIHIAFNSFVVIEYKYIAIEAQPEVVAEAIATLMESHA